MFFTNPILEWKAPCQVILTSRVFQPAALGYLVPAARLPHHVTSTHKVVSSGLFILYNAPCFNPLVVRSIPIF